MTSTRYLRRYEDAQRMNHWLIAIFFILAALSGLSFFHPSLFFFSNLFGGGSWTRILHPFIGLLAGIFFLGLFFKLKGENRMTAADREWSAKMGEMFKGNKSAMPAVGKYNAGQKMVFWLLSLSLLVLVVTGFMFWRPWFAPYFPINVMRIAVLLHSVAAVVAVITLIIHVYAAIWVKGTMRAMTRGTVTETWARKNHALWHADMTRK